MLTEKDLVLIKHDDKIERILYGLRHKQLLMIIKPWFDIPELRPENESTTLDHYFDPNLMKANIIKRMLTKDWARGFRAIQLAHIDLYKLILNADSKRWNIVRLLKKSGDLRLDLEVTAVQELLMEYLSQFYSCYLAHIKDSHTGMYWIRIQLDQAQDFSIRAKRTFKGCIVYVPRSEFLLITGNIKSNINPDIKEALLRVFKAEDLVYQSVQDRAVEHFRNFTRMRQEGGVFAQLRKNQVDANPLDVRQQSKTKDWEQSYVREGEQSRRIKVAEPKKLVARFDILKKEFGWNTMAATNRLDVDLDLPFQPVAGNRSYQDGLKNVKFSMSLRGKHIPLGVKHMIEKGLLETPAPDWLTSLPTTAATYFHVTKDKVSQTKPTPNLQEEEEEEEEEQEEDDNETEQQEMSGIETNQV
ncbi:centromere protein Chl4/mis15/CENP-N [Choanephora cucurbitarum]|nr:centromere protein Chl4/mis15/CENP-N [Choanephora cucurbitarum]